MNLEIGKLDFNFFGIPEIFCVYARDEEKLRIDRIGPLEEDINSSLSVGDTLTEFEKNYCFFRGFSVLDIDKKIFNILYAQKYRDSIKFNYPRGGWRGLNFWEEVKPKILENDWILEYSYRNITNKFHVYKSLGRPEYSFKERRILITDENFKIKWMIDLLRDSRILSLITLKSKLKK